jgi:hypothetical protein
MRKLAYSHEGEFHIRDLFLPIVTLGFFGLRRFRPGWLHAVVALGFLAAWLVLAFVASTRWDGGEVVVVPFVFFMSAVTFFRLLPAPSRRARSNR